MTISLVFSCLTVGSLLLTSMAVGIVRRLAPRMGLVDDPAGGAYKTHTEATPYGGGVAIWIGVMLPLAAMFYWVSTSGAGVYHDGLNWIDPMAPFLLFPLEPWSPTIAQVSQVVAALAAASVLFLLGLADDCRALPAGPRFGVQLAVAALLVGVVPGFQLELIDDQQIINATISVVWIVALANAFNFLDNMNGLAAGLGAITIGTCGTIAILTQHVPATVLCLTVLGACCGFLLFNFPRASIFMGDAGGLFLGFLGGALSILLSNRLAAAAQTHMLPYALIPLILFAVPVYDLVTVVGLRLFRGLAPWAGDTNHISHRLVAAGLTRVRAVLALYVLCVWVAFGCLAALRADPTAVWTTLSAVPAAILLFGLIDLGLARRATSP
ncbi:MAG: MraY family glycosyltransferase [bacterium]|nr:MraY family glycosyltransferase [bacterium]